jgi:hypothetical protein
MPKGRPGTKAPHGTTTRYTGHGCRYLKCLRATREWRREKYGLLSREEYDSERRPAHGTESRYTGYACRCDLCREASRLARRERRAKTA